MRMNTFLPHEYLCYLKEVVQVLHIFMIKSSYFEFQLTELLYVKPDTFPSLTLYWLLRVGK